MSQFGPENVSYTLWNLHFQAGELPWKINSEHFIGFSDSWVIELTVKLSLIWFKYNSWKADLCKKFTGSKKFQHFSHYI